MERVHRFVSNNFTVRAAAINATVVVREMQRIQNTSPLPTIAVGRAMVGALLLASHLKERQQVGLYVRGDGPMGRVFAEAHFEGQVRGYTPHTYFEPQKYSPGLSLKEHIGQGTLSVTRHMPFQKQPHHGTVELVSSEIGEDIGHYLIQSHQIRSIISLGVYLDTYGKVQSAGGVLVEVMPGVGDDVVDILLKNSQDVKTAISEQILNGGQPVDFVKPYLNGIDFTELDHDFPISYYCPCNEERVLRAIETLGIVELDDMIANKETAQVMCQMCGKPYDVSPDKLTDIKNKLYRQTLN
jgi:molecular chaperone Hsp33